MTLNFEPFTDHRCELGEGPVWDERRDLLFYVDILGRSVHAVALDGSGRRSWAMPQTVGSVGLCESGRLIVALKSSLVMLDPESGAMHPFATLPDEPEGNRLNDGKVGPDGCFWVGSMDDREHKEATGSLYRVSPDGSVAQMVDGLIISNGLAWTGDGATMFHADARGPWIDRYDFHPSTGEMENRVRIKTLDELTEGRPDGAACDEQGLLWSAGIHKGQLNVFDAGGTLLGSHPVPTRTPTMPCFCGPDLSTIVVTSLVPGRDADEMAGRLFISAAGFAGARVSRFRDE